MKFVFRHNVIWLEGELQLPVRPPDQHKTSAHAVSTLSRSVSVVAKA